MFIKTENGKTILQKHAGDEGWELLPDRPMLHSIAELMCNVWGDTTRFVLHLARYDYDRSYSILVYDKAVNLYIVEMRYQWVRNDKDG